MTPNITAFLAMIRASEGTDLAEDPYRCTYGYKYTLISLADHPLITGEWLGEQLPESMCIAAGMNPICKSTAAGAYQYRIGTWKTLKARLSLANFSPSCQDSAATEDISSIGGLRLINEGRIQEAIQVCRGIWASLPGNPAHQPQRTLADLIDVYQAADGTMA